MTKTIKDIPLKSGEKNAYLRYLTTTDLPDILELQTIVYEALEDKKRLETLGESEFRTILEGEPLMVGIFHQEKLIAFRAFLNPIADEEGLGEDIGLTEEHFAEIIYSEISNVHPDYRGNHLQTKMGEFMMEQLDRNRFRYILATVAPGNIPSMKDKFALGMRIYQVKAKYGGKLRYIYCNDLALNDVQSKEQREIDIKDIGGQAKLIEEGYIGIEMKKSGADWIIVYQK
ncbi:hypothetical protein NP439_05400 [Oceanobacillus jeddahense]|uniref:N-acetyltransferase domain-containing protein n=1 Tax=Oceanobacillus jeddahense TaxID=1462527 RepID=A0ABY5JXF7_9BACI|nr:hypothetical protein [Oceanobacillus jeddahense]UUI04122.1 hypothetical protein NP439_05400 [Oceanobacillus jeddahense]